MYVISLGVFFSVLAMLGWGFGDFFLQKLVRVIGDWEITFLVSFFGLIVLSPFIGAGFMKVFNSGGNYVYILIAAGALFFLSALSSVDALKRGKITVVEPIWSSEVMISALLAFFILKEKLSMETIVLIIFIVLGLILVSIKERGAFQLRKFFLEKGAVIAIVSAIAMGLSDFVLGWGARVSSPITVSFFVDIIVVVLSAGYLLFLGRFRKMLTDVKNNLKFILSICVVDNAAWLCFAFAMALAPIGIVGALSEGYIIISVVLGLVINKEKLQTHQKIGLALALLGAITLAVITL